MAAAAYLFLVVFLSVYFEVMAGAMGIIVPLAALTVFYLSISFGWRAGLITGTLAGLALDMLYGRELILTPCFMMLTVGAAEFWLYRGDPVSILPNLIPGAAAAFLTSFPALAVNSYNTGALMHNFHLLVFSTVSGALLLPLIISLLDYAAEKFGLPLYRKARAAAMNKRE